jgi:hypothetical protein
MSETEMYARLICLERSLKKANYRIFLLEKKRNLSSEAKGFYENRITAIQLNLFDEELKEVIGG